MFVLLNFNVSLKCNASFDKLELHFVFKSKRRVLEHNVFREHDKKKAKRGGRIIREHRMIVPSLPLITKRYAQKAVIYPSGDVMLTQRS